MSRRWIVGRRVLCSCPSEGTPGEGVVQPREGFATVLDAALEVLRDGAAEAHRCSTATARRVGRPDAAPFARLHTQIDQRQVAALEHLAAIRGTPLRPVLEEVIAAGLATPALRAELTNAQAPAVEVQNRPVSDDRSAANARVVAAIQTWVDEMEEDHPIIVAKLARRMAEAYAPPLHGELVTSRLT